MESSEPKYEFSELPAHVRRRLARRGIHPDDSLKMLLLEVRLSGGPKRLLRILNLLSAAGE